MKNVYIATCVFAVIILFSSCAKSDDGNKQKNISSSGEKTAVTWYNFNDGIKLAIEKKRPVVMDFFADWCYWCKRMDIEIFTDPDIEKKLNSNYICIRVYTDRDMNEMIKYKTHVMTKNEFAMMLGVRGLPTVVFMDKEGNLITKIPGYIKKNVFMPLLDYIQEECYLKKVPFEEYMGGRFMCGKDKK